MLRDKLQTIQDWAFLLLVLEIGVVINLVMTNWVLDLGWELWSMGKYLIVINVLLATVYLWAWIVVWYFDTQSEAQNKTREEIEAEKEARKAKKEQKKREREEAKRKRDEAAKELESKSFDKNTNDSNGSGFNN